MKRLLLSALSVVFLLALIPVPAFAQEEDIVAKHRGSSPTLSPADAPRVLRAIAADLNRLETRSAGLFGILVKTTGNNCGGYSCDIICRKDGLHWDVFADGPHGETNTPGPSRPQFSLVDGSIDPSRCEVVPAGGGQNPPPPPPSEFVTRAELEGILQEERARTWKSVSDVISTVQGLLERDLNELRARVAKLEAAPGGGSAGGSPEVLAILEKIKEGQATQTAALKAAIAQLQADVKAGVKIRF